VTSTDIEIREGMGKGKSATYEMVTEGGESPDKL